jgi:hypothetical protein
VRLVPSRTDRICWLLLLCDAVACCLPRPQVLFRAAPLPAATPAAAAAVDVFEFIVHCVPIAPGRTRMVLVQQHTLGGRRGTRRSRLALAAALIGRRGGALGLRLALLSLPQWAVPLWVKHLLQSATTEEVS